MGYRVCPGRLLEYTGLGLINGLRISRAPNIQTRETLELEAVKLSNSSCFKLSNSQTRTAVKLSSSQTLHPWNIQTFQTRTGFELQTLKLRIFSNIQTRSVVVALPNSKLSNCRFRARDASNSRTLNLETPSSRILSKLDIFQSRYRKELEIEFERRQSKLSVRSFGSLKHFRVRNFESLKSERDLPSCIFKVQTRHIRT